MLLRSSRLLMNNRRNLHIISGLSEQRREISFLDTIEFAGLVGGLSGGCYGFYLMPTIHESLQEDDNLVLMPFNFLFTPAICSIAGQMICGCYPVTLPLGVWYLMNKQNEDA